MKKLIYLLLFIPLFASAQSYLPVQKLYVKDIIRFGSFYILQDNDSVWIEKPLGTFQNRIDTTRSSSSSTDSVYTHTVSASATTTINIGTTYNDLISISDYIIELTTHNQSGNAKIMLKGSSLYINSGQTIDTNGGAGIGISITYNLSGSNVQMNIINSTAETGTIKLTIKKI